MVNPVAVAAASSAVDFVGNTIMQNSANAKSKRAAYRSAWLNFWMQNYFMDKQNEYNKPINQRKRLEEANLNPALMYDNGTSSLLSATPSGGGVPTAQVFRSNGELRFMEKMQMAQSMKQQEANIGLTEAQEARIINQIDIDKATLALKAGLQAAQIKYLTKGTALRGQEVQYYKLIDEQINKFIKDLGIDLGSDETGSGDDSGSGFGKLVAKSLPILLRVLSR